jgi:hypothetical protein
VTRRSRIFGYSRIFRVFVSIAKGIITTDRRDERDRERGKEKTEKSSAFYKCIPKRCHPERSEGSLKENGRDSSVAKNAPSE